MFLFVGEKQWVKYVRDNGMRSHIVTLDRKPDLQHYFWLMLTFSV